MFFVFTTAKTQEGLDLIYFILKKKNVRNKMAGETTYLSHKL